MKKFIAAAVLAGLATAAFAQTPAAPTITWGGYLDTGITAAYNGQDRASVGFWGDDAGKSGGRFKLIGKVAAGDYGFNFELRGQGLPTTANTANSGASKGASVDGLYFDAAYAYANFFNKLVYTQVGIIDQRDSRLGGDAAPSYSKETPGAIVVVRPVDGLSVNAFVAPTLTSSSSSIVDLTPVVSDVTSSVGGAYTVPNVVKVAGQVRFANPKAFYASYKYTSPTTGTSTVTGADTYTVTDFYAGAGLLAVPNLTAWIEYQNTNLNNGKLAGKQIITETLAYNFKDQGVAPLSAGLIAYEVAYGDDVLTNGTDKTNLSYRVNPWVSYDLGGIVPKFDFNYFSGAEIVSGTTLYTFDLLKNPTAVKGDLNKIAVIELKPSVKFVLTPTTTINLVVSYLVSAGSDDVVFLGSTNTDAKSQITTQANFTYSF